MWLLDTTTLKLRDFNSTPPPYAILSHTWGDEEVSFQELKEISLQEPGTSLATQKEGYRKIEQCCKQARSDGLRYAWVDTCCIDKRSSAELSEAINAMYRWYSEAQLCYAHLADVSSLYFDKARSLQSTATSYPKTVWGLSTSRYFTRGWTLQEVLAPMHVIFFDQNWAEIGTKASLLENLVELMGVPSKALLQPLTVQSHSVADRMSWASKRETSREEDQAYSLLGIFGISMPLLYGEGKKAFHRLQLQILSESNDRSIFAWATTDTYKSYGDRDGISVLADSPAPFSYEDHIHKSLLPQQDILPSDTPITITNIGLSVSLPIMTISDGSYVALLNCFHDEQCIAIHVTGESHSNTRSRSRSGRLMYVHKDEMQVALSQRFYMSTRAPPLQTHSGPTKVDLSFLISSEQHGWRWIYYSTSAKDRPRHGTYSKHFMPDYSSISALRPGNDVEEGEWLNVIFVGVDGGAFRLVFGPREGRLWCHGMDRFRVSESVVQNHNPPFAMRQVFADDARRFDGPPWPYCRDRITYRLDSLRMLHVAIKPMTKSPELRYRVEMVQENISNPEDEMP